ncbi:MAG: response regulator [Chloroflexota bacterium]
MSPIILIVDDAPDWRAMLAGLIGDVLPQIQVLTAASMEEARRQLTQHPIRLAIIDIRLDESDEDNIDGLTLAEFIRAHYPQTQALIITGYANLETVKRAMQPDETGARLVADYIQKENLHNELLPRLSAVLGEA